MHLRIRYQIDPWKGVLVGSRLCYGQQPPQTSTYCSGSITPPSLSELLCILSYFGLSCSTPYTIVSVVCELLEADGYPRGGYFRPCTLTISLDTTRSTARRRTNCVEGWEGSRAFHMLQLERKERSITCLRWHGREKVRRKVRLWGLGCHRLGSEGGKRKSRCVSYGMLLILLCLIILRGRLVPGN